MANYPKTKAAMGEANEICMTWARQITAAMGDAKLRHRERAIEICMTWARQGYDTAEVARGGEIIPCHWENIPEGGVGEYYALDTKQAVEAIVDRLAAGHTLNPFDHDIRNERGGVS